MTKTRILIGQSAPLTVYSTVLLLTKNINFDHYETCMA